MMKNQLGRGLGTIGVCALGAFCMFITNSSIGIGWAIFGVFLIWATAGYEKHNE